MATSLDEFKQLLAEVSGTTRTALAGITALPLVSLAVDLSPPWPRGVVVATCVVELVVLMLTFHYARRARGPSLSRALLGTAMGLLIASIAYFALVSLFVYDSPNGDRFVKGYECTSDAVATYGNACPLLPKSLIREANYDADRLWTQLSLLGARMSLLTTWALTFVCLSALTGCFVVHHMNCQSRRKER